MNFRDGLPEISNCYCPPPQSRGLPGVANHLPSPRYLRQFRLDYPAKSKHTAPGRCVAHQPLLLEALSCKGMPSLAAHGNAMSKFSISPLKCDRWLASRSHSSTFAPRHVLSRNIEAYESVNYGLTECASILTFKSNVVFGFKSTSNFIVLCARTFESRRSTTSVFRGR